MHRTLGAIVTEGSTIFRVWAPVCRSVQVEIESSHRSSCKEHLQPLADGFFGTEVAGVQAGDRYRFVLDERVTRPDPASRFQPEGVHGWSEVINPNQFEWKDRDYHGVSRQSLVIYEVHIGVWTEEGTYLAALERLPELKQLGITAIELMPIAESAGNWNWGYDGVNFFAPRHTYGTPDELRALINATHEHGMAVILDVVYNHFGPEGNYLRDFGGYISDRHATPWGDAPNFDSQDQATAKAVREFFIANATYWIEEFHFDGLRIDAIHCMADDSPVHVVTELSRAVQSLRGRLDRHVHLIAESNVYDPEMCKALDEGGHGFDAMWCDDFLHATFAVLRPGDHMSHRTYDRSDMLATLRRGFVYQGSLREPRRKLPLTASNGQTANVSSHVDTDSLVFSIQNHDFIGNHPLGQRLHQLTSDDAHRAAAALLLLYPAIPMLFNGEEFANENPFFFFVDYSDPAMRDAVERGRKAEYPQHDWTTAESPLSAAAFESSRIGPASGGNAITLKWYHRLIESRRSWQNNGLLNSRHLDATWVDEIGLAWLNYSKGEENRFVIVRLGDTDRGPTELFVSVEGEVELCQSSKHVAAGGRVWQVEPNGVLIGAGTARIVTSS